MVCIWFTLYYFKLFCFPYIFVSMISFFHLSVIYILHSHFIFILYILPFCIIYYIFTFCIYILYFIFTYFLYLLLIFCSYIIFIVYTYICMSYYLSLLLIHIIPLFWFCPLPFSCGGYLCFYVTSYPLSDSPFLWTCLPDLP